MKKFLMSFILLANIALAKETILVQGAMDMEVDFLIKSLENPEKKHIGSWTFWKGKIGEHTVVVSRTEVGLVNAAAATTIGIEEYEPTIIINQGTSGGHDKELHSGDIVIATDTINIGAFRTERKEVGIADSRNDEIFFDVVQTLRVEDNKTVSHQSFNSDDYLVKIANKTKYTNGKVVNGVIGSADQWNREIERIKTLNKKFNTKAEEMETVAVAQVAEAFKIPFLGIRVLSNTEIHNEEFNPKTALWCQEFTVNVIKNIK